MHKRWVQWAGGRWRVRGSKATRDMDCVHKYVQHIADVSSPKAEYVRHFEAVTPRAPDGRYLLTSGSPPSHAFAEVEGSLPFLDREVQQTVETMVESLVFADKHMDNLSNHDLGVEVHDVPADGDCLLHSWVKAVCILTQRRLKQATIQPRLNQAEIQPKLNGPKSSLG